jgi:hypothetical protein
MPRRPEPSHRTEFGDGLVELALSHQRDGEVGVGVGGIRLKPNHLAPGGHGLCEHSGDFRRLAPDL